MANVTKFKTIKNNDAFVVDNFLFETEKSTFQDNIKTYYIRCSKKRWCGCKARCVITEDKNGNLMLKSNKDHHIHEPQSKKILKTVFKSKLCDSIKKNNDKSLKHIYKNTMNDVFENTSNNVDYDIEDFNVTYNSVQSSMYRERSKFIPTLPKR